MQSRISVDGFLISASSGTPSNFSGTSEQEDLDSFRDVYIWGQVLSNGASDGIGTQFPSKIDVLIPKPLESNVILDVCQIATGAHHIGVVTKEGHVFTWGKESGGRLGHGIDKDFVSPREVKFLEATNFDSIACGEYHTGVISKCYELYTWGDGTHNVGLLGHGSEASHWIPKIVNGPLEGLQVVSVACGTWHSALATSNGKLFTFGDGAFGVLGHGDQESVWYPKEVQLLSGLKTKKVACGVWHTAAIIEVALQSDSNTLSGKLFTWGDGDKHRLGHGNKETYLQPTRVGPLMEYNFHQVACGHTMTVALTTSGHIFSMGGTEHGQLGNPVSVGKIPTLVQDKLLGEYVEKISCGAHHVAVLTTKGGLFTWGMGANGRLGHGDLENRKSPTLVIALKDRIIKNISCGSNFTSCICVHKWVSGVDQALCSGCRQPFGLTRLKHNCHNCGLVFCHACSSRKSLKTALTATPERPHRVCDNCYVKLKVVNENDASKLDRKTTPSHYTINEKEKSNQGVIKSAKTFLAPITEPVKYLEIKNNNPESSDSASFVRASLVPSLVQLKDVSFPGSLGTFQNVLKPIIPPSPPQTPPPQTNSGPLFTTTRQSPTRPASPGYFGCGNDNLRMKNHLLNQEVSKLQKQIQSLKKKSDMQDVEIKKLKQKATEASALAAVESSNHRVTKEFVESTIHQMKEMTDKLPGEITESKNLRSVLNRVKNFLQETSEFETSSSPKLETKQKDEHDRPTSNSDSYSKLQIYRVEENVDANLSHDKENFLEERNKPSTDTCKDRGNSLKESDEPNSEIEYKNAPRTFSSTSDGSEMLDDRLEENAEVAIVDQSEEAEEDVFQECIGSRSRIDRTPSSENSNNGSRSLDSSRLGKQGEEQIIEKFDCGVYVMLVLQSDGAKIFKRVKFSKRRFTEKQAEEWWNENKGRVLRTYCQSHYQKLTNGSSNVTPHVKQNIEASPS